MSKELGEDCLVKDCSKVADALVQDNGVMVSVCKEHKEEL